MKKTKGFSLLEAIVALLLVSIVSIAIFSWISTLFISIEKIEENANKNRIQRNTSEFLFDINVMTTPSGSYEIGPLTISWEARLIVPIERGRTLSAGATPFELGLYGVSITVIEEGGKTYAFEQIQVGYRSLIEDVF